jgi:hypothetical protein
MDAPSSAHTSLRAPTSGQGVPAPNITAMGYSVRTQRWRLTEWLRWDGGACAARFDATMALELYDHRAAAAAPPGTPLDFDATENENVAAAPANAVVVKELRAKLRARFDTGARLGCPPEPKAEQNYAALEEQQDEEMVEEEQKDAMGARRPGRSAAS